jgi:hypothetical protein
MKNIFILSLLAVTFMACDSGTGQIEIIKNDLRAPAYPLITIDPYTCAWSFTDKLYDDPVRHWTGAKFPLTGAIRVDGKVYRFMGIEEQPLIPIAGTAATESWTGRYMFSKPKDGWQNTEFDDSKWNEGRAAFGSVRETSVQTLWRRSDGAELWVRREIYLDEDLAGKKLFLEYSHDHNFELYINGMEVVSAGF